MKKRLLAGVLAAMMMVSMMATTAFAAGLELAGEQDPVSDQQGPVDVLVSVEPCVVDEDDAIVLLDDGGPTDREAEPSDIVPQNINYSNQIKLGKGGSKTISFDVNGVLGGLIQPDHNAVSVVITKVSGSSYQYISEDITNDRELANEKFSSSTSRVLSNLVPGDSYEITLINLGTDDLVLDVSITSYIA